MRTYISILIKYALLLTALPAFCQDGVRRLDCGVITPADHGNTNVWNLSDLTLDEQEGICCRSYGDSIVSEEYGGIRAWYAVDSTGLIRVEGLLWRIEPMGNAGGSKWGESMAGCFREFMVCARRESLPSDTLPCRLERMADVAGIAVLPGPDSIHAVMRRELLEVTDRGGTYLRDIRRWFAANDVSQCALPVATSIRQSYAGELLDECTFVMGDHALTEEENGYVALENLDLHVSDGIMSVRSKSPLAADVRLDITDPTGINYLYTTIPAGSMQKEADISSLPRGRYIASLTSGTVTRRIVFTR